MRFVKLVVTILILLLLSQCSTTKNSPEANGYYQTADSVSLNQYPAPDDEQYPSASQSAMQPPEPKTVIPDLGRSLGLDKI